MRDSAALFDVEGEVFEILSGCGLASLNSGQGAIFTLNRDTPGIKFSELRCGQRVRCEIGRDFRRVVRAELVNWPIQRAPSTNSRHDIKRSEYPLAPSSVEVSPLDAFLRARIEAIKWLRSEEKFSDEEIATAVSLNATEVLMVRARASYASPSYAGDMAVTMAAPLE